MTLLCLPREAYRGEGPGIPSHLLGCHSWQSCSRTPFKRLSGAPQASHLCVFDETVFATIPDHEVRAAKLTNRWIIGWWWRRDAVSDEPFVGTKCGLLKCRLVRRKPPGKQWKRRETELTHVARSAILTRTWTLGTSAAGTRTTGGDSNSTSACTSATT